MKKVVVVGGGFAGLSALAELSKYSKRLNLTLIDAQEESNFLPMLPDILGKRISPEYLLSDIRYFCDKRGIEFIKDKLLSVELSAKEIACVSRKLNYDYLLIASGSETNFYGNEEAAKYAYKLDSVSDAVKISGLINEDRFDNYLIAGAGYTGIEVATNLRALLNKKKSEKRITIIERAPSILGPLPDWMKNYVRDNLKKLDIEVLTNSAIEKIQENKVLLADKRSFDNAMLIWAAGVKSADFVQNLNAERNPQGRLKVDEYLRINESCFSSGDASFFGYQGNFLRMAVQFAIAQGACAAGNIIKSIEGKAPVKYRPRDFGYIIPMANNRACGIILGIKMKGLVPLFLHYFMCIYRSAGLRNKLGIFGDLIMGGAR